MIIYLYDSGDPSVNIPMAEMQIKLNIEKSVHFSDLNDEEEFKKRLKEFVKHEFDFIDPITIHIE